MADQAIQEAHDLFLAEMPADATHDAATCAICATSPLEGAPVKSYTEDELRAAVEAGTADLRTELDGLRASAAEQETVAQTATRIAEEKAPLEAKITELQTALDAAVLEAAAEKARADAFDAEKAAAAEAATLEARKDERLAKVKEVANFPDEYLTANADRFVAMSDEDFEARLEDYRQIAAKATGTEGIPGTTALLATRETAAGSKSTSAVSDLFAMRRQGIDPRTL